MPGNNQISQDLNGAGRGEKLMARVPQASDPATNSNRRRYFAIFIEFTMITIR